MNSNPIVLVSSPAGSMLSLGQLKEEVADDLDELTQLQQQLEAVGPGELNGTSNSPDTSSSSGLAPHYMQPNFASILPEYVNTEADVIRNAFTTGNFQSIQKIPAKVVPNAINQSRLEQMETNRLMLQPNGVNSNSSSTGGHHSANPTNLLAHDAQFVGHCPKLVTKNGLFSQFEYTPSRFSLAEELAQMERLQEQAKRLEISGKDFVSGSNPAKLKYEDAFGNTAFRYPRLEQPYADDREAREQQLWIEHNRILHGAFVPSGQRLDVDVPTKKLLPDLLRELHELIRNDWRDTVFTITPTVDDTIVVRFTLSTVECESGLIAYMNVFCKSHWLAAKYQLQKVMDDWNSRPGDNGLYFVLRPPWARAKAKTHLPFRPNLELVTTASSHDSNNNNNNNNNHSHNNF